MSFILHCRVWRRISRMLALEDSNHFCCYHPKSVTCSVASNIIRHHCFTNQTACSLRVVGPAVAVPNSSCSGFSSLGLLPSCEKPRLQMRRATLRKRRRQLPHLHQRWRSVSSCELGNLQNSTEAPVLQLEPMCLQREHHLFLQGWPRSWWQAGSDHSRKWLAFYRFHHICIHKNV